MQTKVLALTLAVVTVGAVVGPAAAVTSAADAGNTDLAVDVAQDDGVTVTVTDNGTGVGSASVEVATVDQNATYNGTGNYTTGENGTVSLPSPTEHVEVSVTATYEGETATTTAVLQAGENSTYENFGQSISTYVAILNFSSLSGPPGHYVASFAVSNNPGNAPEHAGPPENRTDGNENGPPDHAGPPEDRPDDDETDDNETDDENGPPDHAGPPENRTDDDETDDEADDDENGPPDHAGPPDDGENEDSDDGNNGNGRAKGGN